MSQSKKVNVSLDEELLQRADDYADNNYLTRSGLISVALNQYLVQKDVLSAINEISVSLRRIADSGKIDNDTLRQLAELRQVTELLGAYLK